MLSKFSSNTQRIQVGNGQYVSLLFVIPVIIDIHGHRFKIFTLVSEIHDNVDLVMGMKNIFELEGVIDSRESCFSFLSRSIPFFPVTTVEIAPASQKMVMVDAPFVEELSGMAMVKILDMKEQTTNMIKLKFIQNKAVLKIKNKTHKTITFGKTDMMGVVDLRSLGFYKIKQEILQEHLSRHYHFELANDVCDQYNRLVNLMRKEEEKSEGKFPWLDNTDERKYMTDREILDKYVNLDNSCLTKVEKEQVRDLLYQYKDAFSLRDEIGLCPNIEELKLYSKAIRVLSKGYLPISLLPPSKLEKIWSEVRIAIAKSNKDYDLVLTRLYIYYDMKLVTFGIDSKRNLIVQFPVFIQPYTKKRLIMYQIETVLVPILDKNEQAQSYTELKVEKPYIALNEETYITLHSQELKMCKRIGYEYYCKELFVIKSKTRYSCTSAIYFNLESDLIKTNCEFQVLLQQNRHKTH